MSGNARYTYRGYEIVKAFHPTRLSPKRMTWDVVSGTELKYSNVGSIDTAKHLIDVMISFGSWPDKGTIG